jgi:hypothetical protein
MTTLIMQATPFVGMVAPKLQTVYLRLLRALDAFAENRMRNAVPESEQRRAAREIKRYRRMMNSDRESSATTAQGRP